ncbi:MAG: hypothetical protein RL375_3390 [Pseudomonadota bacterium]|jgi:hypothetical protein
MPAPFEFVARPLDAGGAVAANPFRLVGTTTDDLRQFFVDGELPEVGDRIDLVVTARTDTTVEMKWRTCEQGFELPLSRLAESLEREDPGQGREAMRELFHWLGLPWRDGPRDFEQDAFTVLVGLAAMRVL